MEIKNRFTGKVIGEGESIKEICKAKKANLYEADLRGADLRGADLRGAKWVDEILLKFLSIGPIGSRNDYLQVFITKTLCILKTGCFNGSIEEFKQAVNKTHSKNVHSVIYNSTINMIESIVNQVRKEV